MCVRACVCVCVCMCVCACVCVRVCSRASGVYTFTQASHASHASVGLSAKSTIFTSRFQYSECAHVDERRLSYVDTNRPHLSPWQSKGNLSPYFANTDFLSIPLRPIFPAMSKQYRAPPPPFLTLLLTPRASPVMFYRKTYDVNPVCSP